MSIANMIIKINNVSYNVGAFVQIRVFTKNPYYTQIKKGGCVTAGRLFTGGWILELINKRE